MNLNQASLDAFSAHAIAEFPNEAVGLLVNDTFVPVENTADQPRTDFRIAAETLTRTEATIGRIQAILHTHPYDADKPPQYPPEWPSEQDMTWWLKGSTPWGIAATDGKGLSNLVWLDDNEIAPLKGRQFVSGAADCYTLIRDWFRVERGITLMNHPRGIDWMNKGQDLYEDNWRKAGFIDVSNQPVEIGDVVLFRLASHFRNHAGVITGPNKLLHHMMHRISGEEPYSKWARQVARRVRHVGAANEA